MSEIDKQIIETIVQLMRDGGQYATIGLVCWFTYQILRLLVIGGIVWIIIKSVSSLVLSILVRCKEVSDVKISLISDRLAGDLSTAVNALATQTADGLVAVQKALESAQKIWEQN